MALGYSTAPAPRPVPHPGIPLHSVRFEVNGYTAVCLDLDSTLQIWSYVEKEFPGGEKWEVPVPLVNSELLMVIEKIYRDAREAGQEDKLKLFIFSARSRKETFTHFMKAYFQMRVAGLSLEEARGHLISIDQVVEELRARLGVDVPVATVYDDPGEVGSALPKLRRKEKEFFDYLEAHKEEIQVAVNAGSLEVCESYKAKLEMLTRELREDQAKAGERCFSKAAMLLDVHNSILSEAELAAGKVVSIVWFDDFIKMFSLTLQALSEEFRSRVIPVPLDYRRPDGRISNPAVLVEHIYEQNQMRGKDGVRGPMVDPSVDLFLPALHEEFAFRVKRCPPTPIAAPAIPKKPVHLPVLRSGAGTMPSLMPQTSRTPAPSSRLISASALVAKMALAEAASIPARVPHPSPAAVPSGAGRAAVSAYLDRPSVAAPLPLALPTFPGSARPATSTAATRTFQRVHESIVGARSHLQRLGPG